MANLGQRTEYYTACLECLFMQYLVNKSISHNNYYAVSPHRSRGAICMQVYIHIITMILQRRKYTRYNCAALLYYTIRRCTLHMQQRSVHDW